MVAVRTSVARVAVGLAVLVTFALAAAFGVRSQLSSQRSSHAASAIVGSAAAAQLVAHVFASPARELRAAKPSRDRLLVQSIKRGADRLGPADALGPALLRERTDYVIAPSLLASLVGQCAFSLGFRQQLATEQHRSRAPPRSA